MIVKPTEYSLSFSVDLRKMCPQIDELLNPVTQADGIEAKLEMRVKFLQLVLKTNKEIDRDKKVQAGVTLAQQLNNKFPFDVQIQSFRKRRVMKPRLVRNDKPEAVQTPPVAVPA